MMKTDTTNNTVEKYLIALKMLTVYSEVKKLYYGAGEMAP